MSEEYESPLQARLAEGPFRRAVELADAGEVEALARHLAAHPGVVHERPRIAESGYFATPSLLEWVAENPVRRGCMPGNVVAVARTILDLGADRQAIDATLALVASGRVAREQGAQPALIELLAARGGDSSAALDAAIGHGQLAAAEALLAHGAVLDLAVAAALGRLAEAKRRLAPAPAMRRHLALAWAAQFGHVAIVALLLDAGEEASRLNPPGAHPHSTPLHQAALAGHLDTVRLLLARGAGLDVRDTVHGGTPSDWARYAGHADVVAVLEERRTGNLPNKSPG